MSLRSRFFHAPSSALYFPFLNIYSENPFQFHGIVIFEFQQFSPKFYTPMQEPDFYLKFDRAVQTIYELKSIHLSQLLSEEDEVKKDFIRVALSQLDEENDYYIH